MIETATYYICNQRADGPDTERGIAAGDWRDADRVFILDGCQVYCGDPNTGGHSEPDWSKGYWLQKGDQTQIPQPDGSRVEFKGTERPPQIFVDAWKNGLILEGIIIARDHQRHGL